jgi:uncharacterized protein (DUF433 family)
VRDAAQFLRVPMQTLRRWLEGYTFRGMNYPPVIRPEPTADDLVTWGEFVEAAYLREYRGPQHSAAANPPGGGSAPRAVRTLSTGQGAAMGDGSGAGQTSQDEVDDAPELVVLRSWQLVLARPVANFVHKVEFENMLARRYRPLGRGEPVVADPDLSFGAPTVRGIRTETITELVRAGEPFDSLTEGYDLSPDEVLAALRFELPEAA